MLSLLSGTLFGGIRGFFLVTICATVGASCCYGLSYMLGRNMFLKMFPGMISKFYSRIQQNKDNLLFYMLFCRITPMIPNFFINVASPIIGVPYWIFAVVTLVGLVLNRIDASKLLAC